MSHTRPHHSRESVADIGRHRASTDCPNSTEAPRATLRGQSQQPDTDAGLPDRLNRLFASVHAPDGDPYSNADAVHYMRARGCKISHPYLSQLRNGHRTRPSIAIIRGLASFFGVPPGYLTGDDTVTARHIDEELYWAAVSRNPDVRELITMISELSPEAQNALLADIDRTAQTVTTDPRPPDEDDAAWAM